MEDFMNGWLCHLDYLMLLVLLCIYGVNVKYQSEEGDLLSDSTVFQ
jgi:hypothetical protein